MLEFAFNYILPIISFVMAAFFFIKFWKFRDILDDGTITMIRRVKTLWGRQMGAKGNESQANKRNYDSATVKVGSKIKSLVPFGILDDLTEAEVHAYIMNEATVKFFIKVRDLVGGEWKLPEMNLPKLPGSGGGGGQKMKPE